MKKNNASPISAAASALGRLGGKTKSPARAAASRENGRLGGRPNKRKPQEPTEQTP